MPTPRRSIFGTTVVDRYGADIRDQSVREISVQCDPSRPLRLRAGNGSSCPIAVTAKSQSLGLSGDDIEAAKAMLTNPHIGVTQIVHCLGVSPATLYRYIPVARTANTPGVADFS